MVVSTSSTSDCFLPIWPEFGGEGISLSSKCKSATCCNLTIFAKYFRPYYNYFRSHFRLELVCTVNKAVVCQEKIAGEKVSPMCHMALNPVSMAIMVCREQLIWTYTINDETR